MGSNIKKKTTNAKKRLPKNTSVSGKKETVPRDTLSGNSLNEVLLAIDPSVLFESSHKRLLDYLDDDKWNSIF